MYDYIDFPFYTHEYIESGTTLIWWFYNQDGVPKNQHLPEDNWDPN